MRSSVDGQGGDTNMSEKSSDQMEEDLKDLSSKVNKLTEALDGKAESSNLKGFLKKSEIKGKALTSDSDKSEVATEDFVSSETESKIWEVAKSPEVIGFAAALTLVKLEFPPFFSSEPVFEKYLKDSWGIERNRKGFMPLWEGRRQNSTTEDPEATATPPAGGTSAEGAAALQGEGRQAEEQMQRAEEQARRAREEIRGATGDLEGLRRQSARTAPDIG